MARHSNYVITISRKIGSGGTTLGHAIANHYGFDYMDKEILNKTAERMNIHDTHALNMDKKHKTLFSSLVQRSKDEIPYTDKHWFLPTTGDIFKMQSELMVEEAEENNCVFMGRGGSAIFRDHPKHISIFLTASRKLRIERLREMLGDEVNGMPISRYVESKDKGKSKYYKSFTGRPWTDISEYDLVINTTDMDEQTVLKMVETYLEKRWPDLKPLAEEEKKARAEAAAQVEKEAVAEGEIEAE